MVGARTRGAPLLPPVLLLPLLLRGAAGGIADSVVWAVNAGGDAHVDVNGIHFRKDPLEGRVGRGEGGGHAAAGGFRRDSPRGPARLRCAGVRGPAVLRAAATRAPPAPSCPLQSRRVCGCPRRTAGAPLPQPPGDGRGPKGAPALVASGTTATRVLPPGPAGAASLVPVAVRARGPRGGGMSPAGWCSALGLRGCVMPEGKWFREGCSGISAGKAAGAVALPALPRAPAGLFFSPVLH